MHALVMVCALLAQDTVTLKLQPKVGDKLSVVEKMESKIHVLVNAGGQKIEVDVEQRESKKIVQECLGVDNDAITKGSYKVEEAIEEKKEPGQTEFVRIQKPAHGKTIVVERKGTEFVRTGAEGIAEKDLKDFSLEDVFALTFPKTPVAVGASWEVPPETIKKMFHDVNWEGLMKLTLKEVKSIDGRKCAVLDATIKLKGKSDEGIEVMMDVSGPVIIWIDRGYTLGVKFQGTMGMKGDTAEAKMDGKGPLTLDVSAVPQ
ncbi:MAG TPA: hypothetical protein VE981_10615 [Planctomycetota bacterium]|nr:hypothetical protein [Planctomycetota bacterium]